MLGSRAGGLFKQFILNDFGAKYYWVRVYFAVFAFVVSSASFEVRVEAVGAEVRRLQGCWFRFEFGFGY